MEQIFIKSEPVALDYTEENHITIIVLVYRIRASWITTMMKTCVLIVL